MKLITSSVEILPQEEGLLGAYKQIEKAGRVCYKSEDKICEGSAKKMVDFLIGRGHFSPLEHGTIYLHFSYCSPMNDANYTKLVNIRLFYEKNPYSKVVIRTEDNYKMDVYITTNCRVIFENDRNDDLKYLCEPTKHHEKRVTTRFVCSRSIAQEITRHRTMSFLMESQRYVAYNKDRFGSEITYIIPEWVKTRIYEYADSIEPMTGYSRKYILDEPTIPDIIRIHMLALDRATNCWWDSLKKAEDDYMYLLTDECGLKAEEARGVLPNDCKTELVMTGFVSDYQHFFDLRSKGTTGKPHPDIKVLADYLLLQFT
jgi:thymidylate synthase (FAD)